MLITITQEEINMLQILTANGQQLNNALQQSLLARKAAISLLETKYKAVFDETSGQFEEKEEIDLSLPNSVKNIPAGRSEGIYPEVVGGVSS